MSDTLITLLPVAAAVCVCTIFSEDYRIWMDALVFSTRKSRFPLYLAKVLAGATIVTLTGVFIVGATVAARGHDDSNSVKNQRDILNDFHFNHADEFESYTEYVDDGHTGTDTERVRLLGDVMNGKLPMLW